MLRHRHTRRVALWLSVSALGALLPGSGAFAATYTWSGSGGGLLFSLGSNWTGLLPPLSASTTDLVLTGSTNTGSAASPLNQNIGLSFTLNSLTLSGGASFYLGGGKFAFGGTTATSNTITQSSSFAQSIANVITSTGTKAPTITLTGNGTGVTTLSGQIIPGSRDFAISKTGSSTFSLTAANTYGGLTTVSAGVLNIQNSAGLGSTAAGTSVATGAALQLQGGITVGAEGLTLNGSGIANDGALRNISGSNSFGGAITFGSLCLIGVDAGTLNLGGSISGSFGFTKVGAGTLVLSGANNTFSGTITVQNGTLSFATPVLGASGNTFVLGGSGTTGVLQYTGNGGTTSRSYTMAAGGGGVFDITESGASFTMNTGISGTGSLAKTGAGTLVLAAANTYTGGTTVNAGTLRLGASDRLSDTGGLTVNGGTFDLGTFNETVGALTLSGGTVTGTGTLTTSSASFGLQSGTVNLALGGSTGMTKTTSGTAILNSASSYTGSTAVNAGTLQVNTSGALGSAASGTTVASGAALRLNNVNYSTAEALTINGTGVSNGGALVNAGTSSYAGAITAATNATINAGGGNLTLTGGLVKNGTTLTLTGGGTINVNNVGISGSSPNSDLVVENSTTVVLNATNSYNGPTTVRTSGVLQLGAHNVLPGSPQTAMTLNTSGTLNMAGYNDGVASLAGDNTGTVRNSVSGTTSTLTINPATGVATTYAGTIAGTDGITQGNMALVKTGAGSLTLTGANTFSGSTIISGGTLTAASTSGQALASTSAIVVNSGGTLLLGANNQINDTAGITLAGGTFAKGNFSEGSNVPLTTNTPGVGALTLTAAGSHLDFGSGTTGAFTFASLSTGSFTLSIDNWTGTANTVGSGTTDRLIFNSNQSANLGSFSFDGYQPGATQFDLGNGFYEVAPISAVPEPSTYAAGTLAFVGLGYHRRKRLVSLLRRKPTL